MLERDIKTYEDFKRLPDDQLPALAEEIRAFLVNKVSQTGGHLASNLGVVELTIALHRVFDTRFDRIIFDVGHQSYVHKLITGRMEGFDRLRKKDGLSGFPKTSESPHDAFNTGHASTSISAALGILRAYRLQGRRDKVVAVIGDGALTGGMAFEGLNDAGQSELPLIVVLNDNDMSISYNVGALNLHLNRLRASSGYINFKRRLEAALLKIPRVGVPWANRLVRLKERIKYFLLPNVWFEDMGFTYLGPIDGHDIRVMTDVLSRAKALERPVLVHVVTRKGKGYAPAENHPELFHGIGKFDVLTGDCKERCGKSNSAVFGETLCALAEEDERIVAVSAAMPLSTGLGGFAEKYPARMFDVGIAEPHAVTMAAGLCMGGMRPVVAIYSTFLQRAYDQLLHDVCLQKLPVVFAVDRAGLVGEDGETHQGVYDIAYLLTLPGLDIYSPATQSELREMLALALKHDRPAAIRYSRVPLPAGDAKDTVEYGKWQWVKRADERKVCVIATGAMVGVAKAALEGLDAALVNARFIRPLDEEMFHAIAAQYDTIICCEDGLRDGGFGSMLCSTNPGKARILRIGVPGEAVKQASVAEQYAACGMDEKSIRAVVLEALS